MHRPVRLRAAPHRIVRRTASHNSVVWHEYSRRITNPVRRTPRPPSPMCVHACGVRCAAEHVAQLAIGEPLLLSLIGHVSPHARRRTQPEQGCTNSRPAWGKTGRKTVDGGRSPVMGLAHFAGPGEWESERRRYFRVKALRCGSLDVVCGGTVLRTVTRLPRPAPAGSPRLRACRHRHTQQQSTEQHPQPSKSVP